MKQFNDNITNIVKIKSKTNIHKQTHFRYSIFIRKLLFIVLLSIITLVLFIAVKQKHTYNSSSLIKNAELSESEEFDEEKEHLWQMLFDNGDFTELNFFEYPRESKQFPEIHEYLKYNISHEDYEKYTKGGIDLTILPEFEEEYGNYYILIVSIIPEKYRCHACDPLLAGALFQSNDKGWELVAKNLSITTHGIWGYVPEFKEIIDIGQGKPGVVLYACTMNQGYISTWFKIIGPVINSMELLFESRIYDDSTFCDLEGVHENNTDEASFFRTILNVDLKPDQEYNDFLITDFDQIDSDSPKAAQANLTQRYYFDGCKYANDSFQIDHSNPYSIQIGAFQEKDRSCTFVNKMKDKGYTAHMEPFINDESVKLFKVRIGSYNSISETEPVLKKLKRAGIDSISVKRDTISTR